MTSIISKKANPELWNACKEAALEKMGGKFSARAMQEATRMYKKVGGTYIGEKHEHNSLSTWSKEEKEGRLSDR